MGDFPHFYSWLIIYSGKILSKNVMYIKERARMQLMAKIRESFAKM